MDASDLTSEDILNAYRCGFFPMAEERDSPDFGWVDPEMRGLLPLQALHVPARLKKTILRGPYEIHIDTNFAGVIDGCAAERPKHKDTWINKSIRDLFVRLHQDGHAHSVECWHDGSLVGGVYGLAFGGAFSGESMFSRARDASKIALVHLAARLWKGNFRLFDTQFINPHLMQFGAYEIPRLQYLTDVALAQSVEADFHAADKMDAPTLVRAYLAHLNG